jgi:hypothetical protein
MWGNSQPVKANFKEAGSKGSLYQQVTSNYFFNKTLEGPSTALRFKDALIIKKTFHPRIRVGVYAVQPRQPYKLY